jgi:hypothetical protein
MNGHTPETPPTPGNPPRLRPADAAALDALIERQAVGPRLAGDRPVDPVDVEAARRVEQLGRLLDQVPAIDPPDDLVKRTMHRVIAAQSIDLDLVRTHHGVRSGPGLPVRLSEIVAVAAMVLIGVSLALPVLAHHRAESMRIACEANLAATGRAFGQYAAGYLDVLPRGRIEPGSPWYRVGYTYSDILPVKSNSANLYMLARMRYVDPSTLGCPENAHAPRSMTADRYDWSHPDEVSYSYQNQFASRSTRTSEHPHMAIMADKNPRFRIRSENGMKLYYLGVLPDSTVSGTHTMRGQNVLYADGSVWWTTHSVMPDGDNIWLANGVADYNGTETPSAADDSFLVP